MSAPKHRYELRAGGQLLAKYNTLGQALLGAVWRSRKLGRPVYVRAVDSGLAFAQVDAFGRYC